MTLSRLIAGLGTASEGKLEMRVGEDWVDMSECGPMGRGRATQYIGILHQESISLRYHPTEPYGVHRINLPAELAKMKAIQVLTGVGFTRQDVDRTLMHIQKCSAWARNKGWRSHR